MAKHNKLDIEQKNQLRYKFNSQNRLVEIFAFTDKTDTKYGINWSSIGTVPIGKTKEFIKTLREAIKLTNRLNL